MREFTIQQQPFDFAQTEKKTNVREAIGQRIESFVFSSLLCLFILVAIPYGTVETWWIALYECTVFGLTAIWVFSCWLQREWSLKSFKPFAPLFTLVLFVLLQAAPFGNYTISTDPFESSLFALKLFALTLNGVLLFHCVKDKKRLQLLVNFIIGVVVLSAVFGIVRWAGQKESVGFVLPALKESIGFGQFINKNHFSFLIEMGFALTLGLLLGGRGKREQAFLYLTTAFLMWTAVVLTNSRAGLFTILLSCLFFGATFVFVRNKRTDKEEENIYHVAFWSKTKVVFIQVVLLVCLLATLFVSSLWLGGNVLEVRLADLPAELTDTKGEAHAGVRRVEIWQSTLNLIKSSPIVGSGFGSYAVSITPFHDASGKWTPEAAHNDVLELLSSGGLLGLLIIGWLVWSVFRRVRDGLSTKDNFIRAACYGAVVGLGAIIVHSFFDFGLHVTLNAQLAIALLVVATSQTVIKRHNSLTKEVG